MRIRFIGSVAAAGLLALVALAGACGGETPPAASPASPGVAATSGATLERSPDSGQVDRVGADDGALRPDGVKDLSFVTQVEGPIAAFFLASVDDQGAPTGQYLADTLVGDQPGPRELAGRPGGTTSGIAVFEGDKMVNAKDGSLPVLGAGPHRLTLYVAESATLKPGTKLRVYLQRPDKTLISGSMLTH